jgi:hypothetical protein
LVDELVSKLPRYCGSSLRQLSKTIQGIYLNNLIGCMFFFFAPKDKAYDAITIFKCNFTEVNSSKQLKIPILII